MDLGFFLPSYEILNVFEKQLQVFHIKCRIALSDQSQDLFIASLVKFSSLTPKGYTIP